MEGCVQHNIDIDTPGEIKLANNIVMISMPLKNQ
jgi:hypothetical protein